MSFDRMWADLADVGRTSSGGYRRFAWTREDAQLREWFVAQAQQRGMTVTLDRAGNQWAWHGDPDRTPGIVTGSHLDSVPDGGAFDGPLGVVSAFAAIDRLLEGGVVPARPLGVVNFADEEGARFGLACTGSRLLTGAAASDRTLALRDVDGVALGEAMGLAGNDVQHVGRDDEALRRIACFVELHVEQGKGLVRLDAPVAVASSIWPHGRFRADLPGEANHAGTTALADRDDPMLAYAQFVLAARAAAERHGVVATCGKVQVAPNGVNAIASHVTGWLDARGADADAVRALVAELGASVAASGGTLTEESWTDDTPFDAGLRDRVRAVLGGVPVLATGAGHDAGVLAQAGIATAMLFVRNPTGVSHSPAEHAERDDCLAGVDALATVLTDLAGAAS